MKNEIGQGGESLAADYLKRKGYEIIEQNWRCRAGEIDIVAKEAECYVFCEVKTRRSNSTQQAFMNITKSKARKMIKAAQHYIHEKNLDDVLWRIDAIGIALPKNAQAIIDHVEDVLDW